MKTYYNITTMFRRESLLFFFCYALLIPAGLYGQTDVSSTDRIAAVASRADGITVYYYTTLHEAFSSAANTQTSFENPAEITLLADIVLDEPLLVENGMHIRLVAGNTDIIIQRGSGNIDKSVILITGEAASLTFGKPFMEHELCIDGGYLNNPPIYAHEPLIALNGPDAKLVMYDKVTFQNNYNNGAGVGAGVVIRTDRDNLDRQAEFIMKGGTIRGNISYTQSPGAKGGGVYVVGSGRFIMEGGVITGNTALITGGGVHIGARGSFKKTGGIIYGSNAPAGFRNTAIEGFGSPKIHGHTVSVDIQPVHFFRDDTIKENEKLSYTAVTSGAGIFGEGEKWDTPVKVFKRRFFIGALLILFLGSLAFLILRKRYLKKHQQPAHNEPSIVLGGIPEINLEGFSLSSREKEICELLLTELSIKQIAYNLQLSYSGITFHAQSIYRKLGIQNRTEMFTRFGKNKKE